MTGLSQAADWDVIGHKLEVGRLLAQPEGVHDDGLIGFAIRVVAALMTEDVNLSILNLQTSGIITASIWLGELSKRQSMPGLSFIFCPVDALSSNVDDHSFARAQ